MRAPDFWRRDAASPWPLLLAPLGWAWAAGAWAERRLAQPKRAPVPVISVGNLVAGGAGKTPTAIAVAERLIARGARPHFISRGYGGRLKGPERVDPARHSFRDVGDEPLLLARTAPTWVARNRARGALAAIEAGAGLLILDDAHQNHSLVKDLSLLVIDQEYGVGNGRVIPAGPLREPVAAGFARADAIVAIGAPSPAAPPVPRAGTKPVLRARLEPGPEAARLTGRAVVAFAGIGRPEKFFDTLAQIGCRLAETRAFADHHAYSPDEVMRLVEAAAQRGAVAVTTAKDAVRLPDEARPMVETLSVALRFDDEAALDRLLARFVRRA
jgi:tetraacyldisaccharide 4'-kinase